jgi:hypothetical protein
MKAYDVRRAALTAGVNQARLCQAIDTVLPILRVLKEGKSFWLSWGMAAMIAGLEDYRNEQCGKAVQPLNDFGGV